MAKRAGSKTGQSKAVRRATKGTSASVKKTAPPAGRTGAGSGSSRSASKPARKPAAGKLASGKLAARKSGQSVHSAVEKPAAQPAPQGSSSNGHTLRPAKGSGLSAKDIVMFRDQLLKKRSEIVGNMSGLGSEAKNRADAAGDISSMPIHMADVGTDNYEYELTLGLIEGERAIVKEIDEALDRIVSGTYGLCLATGKPIGKARLKAKPWAKYSYEYALAQERGQYRRF